MDHSTSPSKYNLTDADLVMLALCGIPPDLAQQAQLRRVDSVEGAATVGRNGSGDYSGIVFPYIWPGENGAREYRLRLDHPEMEFKDGKFKPRHKYLAAPGAGNKLYLIPGTDPALLADTALPVIITEGEKKTLALGVCSDSASSGWLAVGLSGVWNWRGIVGKTSGPNGDRRSVKGIITDLLRITWKGRRVTILYDVNVRDNESVKAARRGLTDELRKLGAAVYWFAWPDDTPKDINGIDDLVGLWGAEKVQALIIERARPVQPRAAENLSAREFVTLGEDRYRLTIPSLGIIFELDRMRRERYELIGELAVYCELPGARTVVGTSLSLADFNLSSARARVERANLLAARSQTKDLDWGGFVEEFCQRVLQADRDGQGAVLLGPPDPAYQQDLMLDVERLIMPRHHSTILFGDGGSCKSYIALRVLGQLAEQGIPVMYIDWEYDQKAHEYRLDKLFPAKRPEVYYRRCRKPLIHEVDNLERTVRKLGIQFVVFDSIAYACAGPPEEAEVANAYFRAVNQIGAGSLHIAHINKSEQGDKKPFGSVFWHNSARATWYIAADEHSVNPKHVALFNRKINEDKPYRPVSYAITFTEHEVLIKPADIADSADLSGKLSVRERMLHMLKRGAFGCDQIADEIGADRQTVSRTARRWTKLFVVLPGGKVGLLSKDLPSGADSPRTLLDSPDSFKANVG